MYEQSAFDKCRNKCTSQVLLCSRIVDEVLPLYPTNIQSCCLKPNRHVSLTDWDMFNYVYTCILDRTVQTCKHVVSCLNFVGILLQQEHRKQSVANYGECNYGTNDEAMYFLFLLGTH